MTKPPTSRRAYEARVKHNTRITGYGADVKTHMPCPWCAAPDFMVLPITHADVVMAQEHTCRACGRSGKNLVERDRDSISAELVQTAGPDAPDWLTPPPRRVEVSS